MKYFTAILLLVSFNLMQFYLAPAVRATSEGVVISAVQTSGAISGSSAQEVVLIKNIASEDIDVTDWCIFYSTSTLSSSRKLSCIEAPDLIEVWLTAGESASFATTEFVAANPLFVPDSIFSSGLAAAGGHVWLESSDGVEIDKIGWGTATSAEGLASAVLPSTGKVLLRDTGGEVIDTNNNYNDFKSSNFPSLLTSGLYEKDIIIDVCPNIDDLQVSVPSGMLQHTDGACYLDYCLNIEGLQIKLPIGHEDILGTGECSLIPLGTLPLHITELLPNVAGIDDGLEYIELYNPSDSPISLVGYTLKVGPGFTKSFTFSADTFPAKSYMMFSDIYTGIVLPNTTGASLRLFAPSGDLVSETPLYLDAVNDESWASFSSGWAYTNRPTPASENAARLVVLESEVEAAVTVYAPCAAGKFRNPETNRCKTLESTVAVLGSCEEDEYRNPETNRCRKAVLSVSSLVPCDSDQERNPETNRCRKISAATNDLAPCAVGQERNPETNRCRKSSVLGATALSNVPTVEDISPTGAGGMLKFVVLGVTLMGALGYMLYEWRGELRKRFSRGV